MRDTICELLALSDEAALFTRQGNIVFANRAARRVLGEDCLGRRCDELLHLEGGFSPFRGCLADIRIRGESFLLRSNRFADGRLIFLNRQQEAPAQLNDAFLYCLRSSLMSLGVAADSLRPLAEDEGREDVLQTLAGLTHSYFRLLRLTENVSLVRSLMEQTVPLCASELDLSLLCHAALDAVEEHLPKAPLEREIVSGIRMAGDARLLRLLLFNLVSNAALHAHASTIRVSLTRGHDRLLLKVQDDGVGIPEEELSTVFSHYRQNVGTPEAGSGAGFGLSAARAAAQLHGGTLLLESHEGRGTTVCAALSGAMPGVGILRAESALCTMRELLLGLADCLPESCFREEYLD